MNISRKKHGQGWWSAYSEPNDLKMCIPSWMCAIKLHVKGEYFRPFGLNSMSFRMEKSDVGFSNNFPQIFRHLGFNNNKIFVFSINLAQFLSVIANSSYVPNDKSFSATNKFYLFINYDVKLIVMTGSWKTNILTRFITTIQH